MPQEIGQLSDDALEHDVRTWLRMSRRIGLAFIVFIVCVYAAIAVHTYGRGYSGLVAAILTNSQFVALWIGFGMAFFLSVRAVDLHRRFCTRCRYERATGPGGQEGSGEVCPECGANWNARRGTMRGRIQLRPAVIAVGLLVSLSGLGFGFAVNVQAVAPRLTPTPLLISEIAGRGGFNMIEWAELNTRPITRERQLRLAEGLLRKRIERGSVTTWDAMWLERMIADDALPPDLLERFHREMFDLELEAPERVRAGEEFTVRPAAVFRNVFINNPTAAVIVGGYYVGEDPEPRRRPERASGAVVIASNRTPSFTLTADEPGPLRIRFEYWLLAVDGPGGPTATFLVEWNDDGTPALPEFVRWSERRSAERWVSVE